MYSDPDTCRFLANVLLEYSSNNNGKFWKATSMNLIGNTYYLTGDLDSALFFYEKAVDVLNEIDDVFDEGIIITSYYGHYISYNKKLNLIIAVQMFPTKNFNE